MMIATPQPPVGETPPAVPPKSKTKTWALVIGGVAAVAATIGGIYFYKRRKKRR